MSTLTWLHLSDLHLRGNETSVESAHLDSMLADIQALRTEEDLQVDAVFFSGDLAFSGKRHEYEQVVPWLDSVLDAAGLSGQRDRLFVVPGNHDIDRDVINRSPLTKTQQAHFAEDLLESHDCAKIEEFLSVEIDRKWAFAKFGGFAWFTGQFFNGQPFDHNRYYYARTLEVSSAKIVVIGLNSAWLSFRDHEQGRLLIGERQVCDAIQQSLRICADARLRVVLLHHPLYWLAEKDIHKVIQHLRSECDVMLRGHLHCQAFSIQSTPDCHLHEFGAGASLKAKYHAYNVVRLDLDTGEGTAFVRLQHDDIGKHWGPDSLTYRNAQTGQIDFALAQGNRVWPSR